jgi:homoserine dehydrogenase
VLASIAGALGSHGISIESLVQKGRDAGGRGAVPIVVFTHPASEVAVRSALDAIDRLPEVTEPTRLVRIEEDL